MSIFQSIGRFLDAIVTALAVVFGLEPDPTAIPVEVRTQQPHWPR
jgi:hypothetical protein